MGIYSSLSLFDFQHYSASDYEDLQEKIVRAWVEDDSDFETIALNTSGLFYYIDEDDRDHITGSDCYSAYLALMLDVECSDNPNSVEASLLLRKLGTILENVQRRLADDMVGIVGFLYPNEIKLLQTLLTSFELIQEKSKNDLIKFVEILEYVDNLGYGLFTFMS